jgi:NodT family efflux transporter outer membrane factor (OMF) lipoprotein
MTRAGAVLVVAALLGGCVDAPPTTPSEVALKPGTLGLGSAATPAISDTWWMAFHDPQLNALVDEALRGSPTLATALARVRLAQSELSATRAATYPQVTFDANETRERFSKDYIIPPPIGGSTDWIGQVGANLTWSLDFFGKQQAEVDRARATAQAASLDATAARLLLAGAVAQAYVALWRAYELVDVADQAVQQRQGLFDLTAGRVRAGLETLAAQKQAESLLATAREELIRSRADRDLAVHQIAALIGRGADAYGITRPRMSDTVLALPATLPADLLARRADIAAAQARIDAAFQGREVARKAFYPDINLVALAGWAAIGLSPMFSASALQYGVGGAIHLPIFDAGKLRAEYAGATAGLDQAVADYNAAVVTAVKQTADAMTDLKSLQDQAPHQRDALAAADASYKLALERYRSGLSPQTNALDAESLLLDARRGNAALAADTVSARVALLMAVGGGFTPAPRTAEILPSQDNSHE